MNPLSLVEYTIACVLAISLIGLFSWYKSKGSDRLPAICLLLSVIWLIVDATLYVLLDLPEAPFALKYSVNLLAYTLGPLIYIIFIKYRDMYISERTDINHWLYRVPMILLGIELISIIIEFIIGNVVVFENGIVVADNGLPIPMSLLWLSVLIYLPFVALSKRKIIGMRITLLLGFIDFVLLAAAILSLITKIDLTVCFGALELFLTVTLLQKIKGDDQILENAAHEALVENNTRLFALEDNFESLYEVELESGHYEIYVKGEFFKNNVVNKLSSPGDYFKELQSNIEEVIYPEDREGLYNALKKESVRKELSEAEHFDYYYRIITEKEPVWFKMRVVYKDSEKKKIVIGVFNAENDVEVKQLVEQKNQLQKALNETNEANIRNELLYDIIQGQKWSYKINAKDEVVLATYSEGARNIVQLKEVAENPMEWAEFLHPEDKEEVLKAFWAAIKDHSGNTPYDVSYRMLTKKGQYIWIKTSGRLIHHEDGTGELFGMCIDITEQMEAQQRQKENELDRVKRTMNMIFVLSDEYDPIIVVEPESGEYDWFMSMSEDVVNNTSMTEHGNDLYKNIGIDGASIIHEDDRPQFQAFYARENLMEIARTGETKEIENRWYIQTENRYRWKYNKAVRMIDESGKVYVVIGVIDTTARKEKEEEFNEQRKLILEQQALSDGLAREYHTVWLVDGFGEHKLHLFRSTGKKTVQRAVQRGLDEPTYDGTMVKYVMDSVHEDDRERVLEASKFKTVERETPDVGTYVVSYKRYYDDEGHIDYHQMCFAKAVAEDGTVNYILAFRDADKMLREQIAQQQQLEEARNAAEASNEAKTNFLFNMSHDIRTPMNAITGFTNMAIRHIDEKDRVLDYLSKVQQSGNMLLSLINNVLEVSRIESGKATLDEQPGDVYYSFAEIEDTMRELAATKDITISFTVDKIKNRYIYADFSRCMRVFVNVVTNAIKYTPAGGSVTVNCEQIGEVKDNRGTYKYTISDNGIGMSEEFQKHIFDQFARENNATVSGIQGTGLGMSVVKSFVELMGGTISVKSKKGEGSTFTIVLPLKLQEGKVFTDPKTGELVADGLRITETETPDFTGKTVLLVEDNEYNREIAREILEDEGFVVEDVDDGTEAVKALKEKGPDYFNFILMDIQMPVMNGYEATKEIRKMYPDSKLPIIALSANAFAEDKAASLEAGMDDHVAKPIKMKELLGVMAKYL